LGVSGIYQRDVIEMQVKTDFPASGHASPSGLRILVAASHPSAGRRARATRALGGLPKRALDILIATTMLIVLSPLMLLLAFLIWATLGGPIIHRHARIGYGGRTFGCLKFRSMVVNADDVLRRHLASDPAAAREWRETQKLRNDPRVTPLGRFIRLTSLDELPQLFNVIQGDMSCVGPRPVVQDELARYGENASYYLATRPGMTGLWQVSGRNRLRYSERVGLDRTYVTTWSLWEDIKILARTPRAVARDRNTA
jgi:exopolysaccharide production protein ExoY